MDTIQLFFQQFKPFRQVIRVFKVKEEPDTGKIRKTEWFDGYLTGITNRGLFINPIDEYGQTINPLAASFIAFPHLRGYDVDFIILKEVDSFQFKI